MKRQTAIVSILMFATAAPAFGQGGDGPWLPAAEQKKVRALIPRGVPVGKNLKFYRLDPVYQNMFTMNNGRSKFNVITPTQDVAPWNVSGGMHHIDRKEWRNVTGLDLPGQILYWQEDTDVRAFSLVPKWRWQFPTGTIAYDILIRIKDGKEHVFEVRVHEKRENDWDEGTIYRPKAPVDEDSRWHWSWEFPSEGLKGSATTYTGKIDPKTRFIPTRTLVVDDGGFTPPKYAGAGMSCNACHSRVGQLYDVPGRIYREARRGDDGRFSWHPFNTTTGELDTRWPIKAR